MNPNPGPHRPISAHAGQCLAELDARVERARAVQSIPPPVARAVLEALLDDLEPRQQQIWSAAIDDPLAARDPTLLLHLAERLLAECGVDVPETATPTFSVGVRTKEITLMAAGGLLVVIALAILLWPSPECGPEKSCGRPGMVCDDGRCVPGQPGSTPEALAASTESDQARAFYLSVIDHYNKGDRDAYVSGFADPLDCWYSRRREPRSTLVGARETKWTKPVDERDRYAYAIEKVELVATAGERFGFLEEGRILRPEGTKAYARGVVVRHTAGGLWIVGEVDPDRDAIIGCVESPAPADAGTDAGG